MAAAASRFSTTTPSSTTATTTSSSTTATATSTATNPPPLRGSSSSFSRNLPSSSCSNPSPLRGSSSSFSRNLPSSSSSSSSSSSPSSNPSQHSKGVKRAPNGASFISSGIPDLDRILGGGFPLGGLVLIAEDPEAPHHLLLLRTFISQGLSHRQPLLFASPAADPRSFLGTLPASLSSSSSGTRRSPPDGGMGETEMLRIAWQYKKYFGEQRPSSASGFIHDAGIDQEYCSEFDLRKPLDRQFLASQNIECLSLLGLPNPDMLRDKCSNFLAQFSRNDGNIGLNGRIAIQSLCAPQCFYFDMEWKILAFLRHLRAMVRSSNAVAVVSFPTSVLSTSTSKRWQHLADTFLSVRAIPDEDKEMAKLLTGYQDMVGFLHVHKVAQINTQVPVILDATTFSLKLHRRRSLVLERLNQAPVDGSGEGACATSTGKSTSMVSSKTTPFDF